MITYGGENGWPSHVTVGGKLTFKGKPPNLRFSHEPKSAKLSDEIPAEYLYYTTQLETIINDVNLAFGQDLRARTFTEAYYYPFRANAVKSIIVANSKPCEVGRLFLVRKCIGSLKLFYIINSILILASKIKSTAVQKQSNLSQSYHTFARTEIER